jgi:hypothetical protein
MQNAFQQCNDVWGVYTKKYIRAYLQYITDILVYEVKYVKNNYIGSKTQTMILLKKSCPKYNKIKNDTSQNSKTFFKHMEKNDFDLLPSDKNNACLHFITNIYYHFTDTTLF